MPIELAIIIVSYNAIADLEACLQSLAEHPPTTTHRIVVVDNHSSDGSLALVRERFPTVTVIDAGQNVGFSRANNLGIRATRSDLVMLLNSDTEVQNGMIDRLVVELRQDPDVAVVGPRIIDGHGRLELSFGSMMSPFAELRQKWLGFLYARQVGVAVRYVTERAGAARDVDWVSGACLLVRRADAEAVGLLDERYFLYCEDVDFCAAVRARGRRVRFTPAATIVHHRGCSRATSPGPAQHAYRRSQLAFYAKHHPRWLPALRLYLAVRGQLPS